MKVTIVEVAKKANVSVATVSRVINGNYPVKEQTRENVLRVIKELDYTPNAQARDLIKQTSTNIGVIVPSISNMFFPQVINGIEEYLNESKYSIFLCTTNGDEYRERDRINEMISRNVAGIIIVDPTVKNSKSKFFNDISKSVPIVFVNGYTNSDKISSVSNDEESGAYMVMNYLVDNGHRDILFIRGENSYSYDIKERVYIQFMKELNNFNEDYILNVGKGNSIETVNKTMECSMGILDNNKNITAVFACNDLMGIGAINACKKLNIEIPKDLSIIGYDNIELSEMIEPKLTTVDQNMYLLGKNSGILLIEKIKENNEHSKKILLKNFLVKRDT